MATPSGRWRLAYTILAWFVPVSLGLMGIMGYYLVHLSQDTIINNVRSMQESLAVGFADTVYKYVGAYQDLLSDTSNLENFSSMNPAQQESYLNRILQVHQDVLEVSVINASGAETLRVGRFLGPSPEMRNFGSEKFFQSALSNGRFVGRLERIQGLYPGLTVAVAITDQRMKPSKTVGVLAAKLNLSGLSTILSMEFPQSGKSEAAVVASDGFLIADSDPPKAYRPDAHLNEEIVRRITTQTDKKKSAIMKLDDGTQFLAASADVKDSDWVVYIQQPLEVTEQITSEMRNEILRVLFWAAIAMVFFSLLVASHITQPLRVLREAADRLGQGQFIELPQEIVSSDEIGDLARTFAAMSESLKDKTGELVGAKQELEKFTKLLEKRVEARTRELKSAQDELIKKEKLAAIGQMASVVGHEIRNPLAVINNSVYFIKAKLGAAMQSEPKIAKHIKIIESEIQQANGIINEILTYSRQRELQPERVSLNAWLDELLNVYPFPPHIAVDRRFDSSNPSVDIDTAEMQQALRNLLGNAIEVMPQKGAIRVRTVVGGEGVAIEVSDSGPGMPPETLEKIFTPFYTTKARGTGLGLAVVRKVIDRHQGRVEVQSAVGKGTLFRLHVPLARATASPVKPA